MQPRQSPSQREHREPVRPLNRQLPAEGFIRQSSLIPDIVPFSASTLWLKVSNNEFPAPVKLSARITAWRVEEIREWLNRRR